MTEREEEALRRLEVNMTKLVELVESQRDTINSLSEELRASQSEVARLKISNEGLENELSLIKMAKSVAVGNKNEEFEAYLGEIIKRVDSCIKKLETSSL